MVLSSVRPSTSGMFHHGYDCSLALMTCWMDRSDLNRKNGTELMISMCNQKLIFLFLNQNICCGYSTESSQSDGTKNFYNCLSEPMVLANVI